MISISGCFSCAICFRETWVTMRSALASGKSITRACSTVISVIPAFRSRFAITLAPMAEEPIPASHTYTIRFIAWKSVTASFSSNTEEMRDFFPFKDSICFAASFRFLFTSSSFCLECFTMTAATRKLTAVEARTASRISS